MLVLAQPPGDGDVDEFLVADELGVLLGVPGPQTKSPDTIRWAEHSHGSQAAGGAQDARMGFNPGPTLWLNPPPVRLTAPSTRLTTGSWLFPQGGPRCRVHHPHAQRLHDVDSTWPPLRTPGDPAIGWRWVDICGRAREFFALVRDDNRTLGLWASNNPTAQLEDKEFYVLTKVEVAPNQRSVGLGHLILGMSAVRAAELGCAGVLLAAAPELEEFYTTLGGVCRDVRGWPVPRGLAAWVFEGISLETLREVHDELLEEGP